MKRFLPILCAAAISSVIAVRDGQAQSRQYQVTVTNLTQGQSFTPILVTTHKRSVELFEAGSAASTQLAMLAEGGATDPLAQLLEGSSDVSDVATSEGLLAPGASVTIEVSARGQSREISLAAMLIPTNDAFFALNGVALPRAKRSTVTHMAVAYDAGSETNDELCTSIPGPVCEGEGVSAGDGEGYVHVHSGIHGIMDLAAATYDWRNPVAKISIERTR